MCIKGVLWLYWGSNAALEFGDELYFIYTSKSHKAKGQNHIFFDL